VIRIEEAFVRRRRLKSVTSEGRYFRNGKKECEIDEINELATCSKNKNVRDLCRGISELQKGCTSTTNFI
jgi:hypothetical protein